MTYDPETHHRQSIRLKGYDYSANGAYFITICTYEKTHRFGHIRDGIMYLNANGRFIRECFLRLKEKFPMIEQGDFIVMSNHFHCILFIRPAETKAETGNPMTAIPAAASPTIGRIIGYFKYATTKGIDGAEKLWQRNYHDHIIRNERDFEKISSYIINNATTWDNDCMR